MTYTGENHQNDPSLQTNCGYTEQEDDFLLDELLRERDAELRAEFHAEQEQWALSEEEGWFSTDDENDI